MIFVRINHKKGGSHLLRTPKICTCGPCQRASHTTCLHSGALEIRLTNSIKLVIDTQLKVGVLLKDTHVDMCKVDQELLRQLHFLVGSPWLVYNHKLSGHHLQLAGKEGQERDTQLV